MADGYIPYCGAPPLPGGAAWNLDPILIALLLAVAAAYGAGLRRLGRAGPDRWRRAAFLIGWAVLALALVSPLCSLSVALFSARVGQHMLIVLVATPLMAFGQPGRVLASLMRGPGSASPGTPRGLVAGPILFALVLWGWHSPLAYDATLQGDAAYWLMHLTLIGAALLLWRALLDDGCPGCALAASFLSGLHMSLLGALLTLSPRAWFASHMTTTGPWGLTALEDQQLGGLIMWVPGGLLLMVFALAAFGRSLRDIQDEPYGAAVPRRSA